MFEHFLKPIKKFRKSYLPGIVTASADEDPSSIATFSIVGAATGFVLLWVVILAAPLLIAVHRLSARLGDVTKKGLITLIKESFGKKTALFCLIVFIIANLLSLVADIIGMAAGFQLLTGESYLYFIIPLIILVWSIIVFDTYQHIARYFFWFSGILLVYVVSGLLASPDWIQVFKSIAPPKIEFNLAYLAAFLAILGATFSPYSFFWQTKQEIEERRDVKNIKQSEKSVIYGFIYSSFIAFFVILASASAVLNHNINTLTIADIAQALTPLAGGWAVKFFGLGLIGSGILAIPVLVTASAYAMAEYFDWPDGLRREPRRAKGFYSVITFGFLICLAALLFNFQPIKAIFYSQLFVGVLAPIMIYFILKLASSKKVMGSFRCHWLSLLLGWLTIILLLAGDALFIYFLIL